MTLLIYFNIIRNRCGYIYIKVLLQIIEYEKELNNRGWGLVEMLLLSGALLIALLVAIYFIYKLYSSLG